MSNEAFKRGFSELLKRVGDKAEMASRKVALDLQTSMVEMSPVDTGRFKGNWQCGLGTANADTSQPEDKSGPGAIGRTEEVLQGWKPGQKIMLTNSLPYSRRLEHGWSKQAPAGMVRLTVQNYGKYLVEAVKGMK